MPTVLLMVKRATVLPARVTCACSRSLTKTTGSLRFMSALRRPVRTGSGTTVL